MNPSNFKDDWYVYWEKQGSDRLCGQHCLNSLLQGSFYDEVSLAGIAQELDEQEKNLFAESGVESQDFQNFVSNPSNNIADDGNYSIQVISEALKRTADLGVESIDSMNAKNAGDLSKETAFVCNSASHWFAIRKINNKWYNVNSTNKEGPEFISDFYLSAFLNSVRENGYNIFVVTGNFPITSPQMFADLQRYQKWFTESECTALHERNLKKKNYQLNIGGTDERDLQDAIEKSKADYESSQQKEEFVFEDDEDETGPSSKFGKVNNNMDEEDPNKFQAFAGQGVSFASGSQQNTAVDEYFSKWRLSEEDPELGFALLLSVREGFTNRPKPDDDHLTLNFRLPGGGSANYTFHKAQPVETLYDFVKTSLPEDDHSTFTIATTYPRKQLTNIYAGLEEVGLQDMDALIVEKQP